MVVELAERVVFMSGSAYASELHRVVHQQIPWVGALAILQTTNQRSRAVVEDLLRARPDQHQRSSDVVTAAKL